jgi:hypothetical protein
VTGPQQDKGFGATRADLEKAQHDFEVAGARVLKEFKLLEDAFTANRSVGDAHAAALNVAKALQEEATKFTGYIQELGSKVGVAKNKYQQVNEAGAQQIGGVEGMLPGGGQTYSRLVPGSR